MSSTGNAPDQLLLDQVRGSMEIEKMFDDGSDVATWFNLHTKVAAPCPVVNWSHVENGKITRIRVTFDPRPLLGKPLDRA